MSTNKRARNPEITIAGSKTKRRKKTEINHDDAPYLPEDVIGNILTRLPSRFLNHVASKVCGKWSKLIQDMQDQRLLCSTAGGLIIQEERIPFSMQYVEIEQGKVTLTDLRWRFPGVLLGRTECALLLCSEDFVLCVVNCITMQVHKLLWPQENDERHQLWIFSQIVRIPETGEIKVLCPCPCTRRANYELDSCYWMVCNTTASARATADSWRRIDANGTPLLTFLQITKALYTTIRGVIYMSYIQDTNLVVYAIDLRNESVVNIPSYTLASDHRLATTMAWGENLCCLLHHQTEASSVKVVALDNSRKEWVGVANIVSLLPIWNEVGKKIREDAAVPIGWLDGGNALIAMVYKQRRGCHILVAYSLKSGRRQNIWELPLKHHFVSALSQHAPPELPCLLHFNSVLP